MPKCPSPKSPPPTCRAAVAILSVIACLASFPVLAQGTAEQEAACAGDAFKLCRGDIPNVAKITACMGAHKAELSPKCRAVYDAATAPKAEPPKAAAPAVERKAVARKKEARPSATKPVAPKQAKARTTATKTPPPQAARPPKVVAREAVRKKVSPQTVEAPAARRRRPETPPVPRESAAAPAIAATPPAPESGVPGLDSYRASIAKSCAQGLIDPYTCRTTLDLLKGPH